MTTTTLVSPISLSNDLLTGAEWSPSHTHELLQLSSDIKARPGRYASTLAGKFIALLGEPPHEIEADDRLIFARAVAVDAFRIGIFVGVGKNFLDPSLVLPVDQLDADQPARLAGFVVDRHPLPHG